VLVRPPAQGLPRPEGGEGARERQELRLAPSQGEKCTEIRGLRASTCYEIGIWYPGTVRELFSHFPATVPCRKEEVICYPD